MNSYCGRLGIAVPSLAAVRAHPEAKPYALLIVALLEKGEPMTLADVALRFDAAGIAPADFALDSLKRCRPARPPVYRDGDRYALDPHDAELDLWAFRLGLRPPRVARKDPPPAPPRPPTDQRLSRRVGGFCNFVCAAGSTRSLAGMPRLFIVSILVLSTTLARADVDSVSAMAQLRARMAGEWQAVIDAPKSLGWWVDAHGKRYTGDWVVAMGGWRYFLSGGEVRCREQAGKWMFCDNNDFVTPNASVGRPASPSLGVLRTLQRGIFGRALGIVLDDGARGHVVLETVVSTPEAGERTLRRYRAHVTVTAETFAIGEPVLVEKYRETCTAVNGCHGTHWSCWRK